LTAVDDLALAMQNIPG